MQKRVLVVTNMFPSASDPTYGQFVRRVALALADAGIRTDVVGLGKQSNFFIKALAYLTFGLKANFRIFSTKYDCVYIHNPLHTLLVCLPALLVMRPRVALNFHGHDLVPVTARGAALQRLLAWRFRSADIVVVPSERFKKIFDERFGEGRDQPARVFRSGGVQEDYFSRAGTSATSRGRSALFLSRLVREKGWQTFLEIAQRLRLVYSDFRFTISGVGPDRAAISAAIVTAKLDDCVTVVDSTSVEVNRELFGSHRYFIFPTQFDESLALVNLEAMACGCVVFSSDFPTASEYIRHGSDGFVLPVARFVENCAVAIEGLESDTGAIEQISSAAASTALIYRESSVMRQLVSILDLSGG